MNVLLIIAVINLSAIVGISAKDVLGCGGFIKSHVQIDFSSVEVKLLTKNGILKDKINCAPNNGYYFIPLYDKGDYILKLEPPPGWSFTPTEVHLTVDGTSDLCSQGKDVDFVFKGFGITGKVESLGSTRGPGSIEIELKSAQDVRNTVTSDDGTFFFTPVYPGSYTLKITNSKWKVWKGSVVVVVAEGNTELPKGSLVIQGYDVTGIVKTEREPVADATIILFSSTNGSVQVDGCNKELVKGFKVQNNKKPLCHVKSDHNGIFIFNTVPNGKYYVVLHYNGHNIYYQPKSIEFTVEHNSVELKQHFEIIGFTITGRVLKSPNGSPVGNARIYFDDEEVSKSSANGTFKLERLKTGSYNLKIKADGLLFKEEVIKVTPKSKELPDATPTSYQICGHVVSDKPQAVTFFYVGSTTIISTRSQPGTGRFCEYLSPGKYQIQVVVSGDDAQRGLQFFPKVQTIEVVTGEVGSITFSQLKAKVKGKVQCIRQKDCNNLAVVLRPSGQAPELSIGVSDNVFRIDNIIPGMYDVILRDNDLCWKNNKQTVNINNVNIEVPPFIQTGYLVFFESSHDTQLTYKLPGQPAVRSIDVSKGRISHCLEKPGLYDFQINSCHSYESNTVQYDTEASSNVLPLNAFKHKVKLYIQSDVNQGNDVTAMINIDGKKTQIGPLTYNKENGYEIELMLGPSEGAVIVPQSGVLYFTPPILSISGSVDCENLGVKFLAHRGIVFQGKIKPPLAGVLLTVEAENSDALMAETDQNGVYKFPPLDKSKKYKIAAKKDSYVLVGPDGHGDFLAQKLAEIVIEVLDNTDKTPLPGTLLSLSGGESYRSNLQTGENGKITFYSLSPGEYFLRPMMKEYSFEPSSKIITVKEGQIVNIKLLGQRVAYSAYGQLLSLNGQPEENILVVALGAGNCSHFSEESTSESRGQFRIRGLQPYCAYDIRIKPNVHDNIERSAPKSIQIERVTRDIVDTKLVIFRKPNFLDLVVKVYTKNSDDYKSLRLKVCREAPHSTFFTGRVEMPVFNGDYSMGILMHLASIPIDGKMYSVHLESSQQHRQTQTPGFFVANSSFKYLELDYYVTDSVVEQDIKQTSVWTLAIIFVLIVALYNINRVANVFENTVLNHIYEFLRKIANPVFKLASNDSAGNEDIDQIVQSINAVKRKPKPKKVL